jgi:hypothetical protein
VMKLAMDTVEERRYKESEGYEEIDMFHTDKNIVKGHINFKYKKDKGDADEQRPQLRDRCNWEEFKSFTQQWRLYTRCNEGMDDREL